MNARHGLQVGLFMVGCAFGLISANIVKLPFEWMYGMGAVGIVITVFSDWRLKQILDLGQQTLDIIAKKEAEDD
jgi:hypothetical protein